jgi:hypothetical protein
VAQAEDSDSPVALKLKKMWLKTPVNEEQAAQAVLDPAIGEYSPFLFFLYSIERTKKKKKRKRKIRKKNFPRFFRNDFAFAKSSLLREGWVKMRKNKNTQNNIKKKQRKKYKECKFYSL